MSYTIGIEPDGNDNRVVIRRSDKSLLGVPFRSTKKEEAERMLLPLQHAFEYGLLLPLQHAFEYGLRAMREQASRLPDRVTRS